MLKPNERYRSICRILKDLGCRKVKDLEDNTKICLTVFEVPDLPKVRYFINALGEVWCGRALLEAEKIPDSKVDAWLGKKAKKARKITEL